MILPLFHIFLTNCYFLYFKTKRKHLWFDTDMIYFRLLSFVSSNVACSILLLLLTEHPRQKTIFHFFCLGSFLATLQSFSFDDSNASAVFSKETNSL